MTVAVVERLPMPKPAAGDLDYTRMVMVARRLAARPDDMDAMARQQALAARLYGLDAGSFAHILESFPLIAPAVREAAMAAFIGTV